MKRLVAIFSVVAALSAIAEKHPIERYQSIIDRQMFGKPPPGFDPTRPPSEVSKTEQREITKEQEKLQSSIHFSVIRVTPEGTTQVGFTDNSDPKVPKHYVLSVGEQADGWLVKEADAASGKMTIVKGEVEVSLEIGQNSGKGGGTTAKSQGRTMAGGTAAAGASPRNSNGLLGMGSIRERRKQRMLAQKAKMDEEAAKVAEKAAHDRAEREAQAEQERAEREADRKQRAEQLEAIKEELRKAREMSAQKSENGGNGDNEDNASE